MPDHVIDALKFRKADLERKLAAREGQGGYEQNVKDIKTAIAELDAEIQRRASPSNG